MAGDLPGGRDGARKLAVAAEVVAHDDGEVGGLGGVVADDELAHDLVADGDGQEGRGRDGDRDRAGLDGGGGLRRPLHQSVAGEIIRLVREVDVGGIRDPRRGDAHARRSGAGRERGRRNGEQKEKRGQERAPERR